MKPSTIATIQIGLPTSSSFAAMSMVDPVVARDVNVSDINIRRGRSESRGGPGVVRGWSGRPPGEPETAQIDQHGGLEELLGRHRQLAPGRIAAREQRGGAVG